jgi:predicted secreted protein
MAAFAGRALRIKISLDGGTTYTAIAGSTSDNFTVTKEGINITDKDDAGVQTFIDDAVGTWAMEGGFEGFTKDADLVALINDVDQFTYDCEIDVGGLGTYAGKFGFSSMQLTGAEGAEACTMTGSLVSSGTITFTAA